MTVYETSDESKTKFHYRFRCYDCSATLIHKTFEFINGVTLMTFHEKEEKTKQFLKEHGKQYLRNDGSRPECIHAGLQDKLNDLFK